MTEGVEVFYTLGPQCKVKFTVKHTPSYALLFLEKLHSLSLYQLGITLIKMTFISKVHRSFSMQTRAMAYKRLVRNMGQHKDPYLQANGGRGVPIEICALLESPNPTKIWLVHVMEPLIKT